MSMVIENHTQRTIGRLGASTAVVKESSHMFILYNASSLGERMDQDGEEHATSPVL
jgi:hypothetical protein